MTVKQVKRVTVYSNFFDFDVQPKTDTQKKSTNNTLRIAFLNFKVFQWVPYKGLNANMENWNDNMVNTTYQPHVNMWIDDGMLMLALSSKHLLHSSLNKNVTFQISKIFCLIQSSCIRT